MTKTANAVPLFFLLIGLGSGSVLAAPAGQVQDASGDVRVISRTAAPKFARSGDAIDLGTSVQTGERSRVVLKFTDGQVVALASNSTFRLDGYQFDQSAPEKGSFAGSFLRGAARFVTGLIGDRNRLGWRVDTPTATAGIRGTDLMLGLRQGLYAAVRRGSVGLTNTAGTIVVEVGGNAYVASAATLGAAIDAAAIPAGLFSELDAIALGALGGSATGAGGGFSIGGVGLPGAVGIALGVGLAAAAASGGGETTVTTHH